MSINYSQISKLKDYMMDLGERLINIRHEYNYTQKDFAKKIGVSPTVLLRYEKNTTIPSSQLLEKISNMFPRVNGAWLLSGTGGMLIFEQNINLIKVKRYIDISVSAGFGVENHSADVDYVYMNKSFLSSLKVTKYNNLEIIQADGESMEPEIMHNDYLLIDRLEDSNIIDGKTYIFRHDSEVFVKQLIKTNKGFKAISKNKNFDTRTYEGEDSESEVVILGKVLLAINKL